MHGRIERLGVVLILIMMCATSFFVAMPTNVSSDGSRGLLVPNLKVDNRIRCKPTHGLPSTITTIIKNTGVVDAYDVTVNFYEGKITFGEGDLVMSSFVSNYHLIDSVIIPSINAASSVTISTIWKDPTEGMHGIRIYVDECDTIEETDESDNVLANAIYVNSSTTKSYLIYGYVKDVDGDPVRGAIVTLSNEEDRIQDVTDSEGRFDQNLINLQGGFTENDNINVVATYSACKTNPITFTPDLNGGKQVYPTFNDDIDIFELKAESFNSFSFETNLKTTKLRFIVNDAGNLYYDENLVVNNTVTIEATVYNSGSTDVSNIIVQFLDDDTLIGENQVIPFIASGYSKTVSVDWIAYPIGIHTITAIVDSDNNVEEIDEMDNKVKQVKYIRKLLASRVIGGWNKLLPDSLDPLFTAGAMIAGTHHKIKYVVKFDEKSSQYINYISKFTTSEFDFSINISEEFYAFFPYHNESGIYRSGSYSGFGWQVCWSTTSYSTSTPLDDGLCIQDSYYEGYYVFREMCVPWLYDIQFQSYRYELGKDEAEDDDPYIVIFSMEFQVRQLHTFWRRPDNWFHLYVENAWIFGSSFCEAFVFCWSYIIKDSTFRIPIRINYDYGGFVDPKDQYRYYKRFYKWWGYYDAWSPPAKESKVIDSPPYWYSCKVDLYRGSRHMYLRPELYVPDDTTHYCVRNYYSEYESYPNNYVNNEYIQSKDDVYWYDGFVTEVDLSPWDPYGPVLYPSW